MEYERMRFYKREEGREEGLAAGLAEGRAEGRESGLAEGERMGIQQNKLETAKRSLQKGLSIELVADITGLTLEQVQQIELEISQLAN